jgi:hypothetical protein
MRRSRRVARYAAVAAAGAIAVAACAAPPGRQPARAAGDASGETPATAATQAPAPTQASVVEPTRPIVIVTDAEALAAVADGGGSFGAMIAGGDAAGATLAELAATSRWRAVAAVLERDLGAIERADPHSGVGVRGNAHRLFDAGWLRSPRARFDLIGVTRRIDRAPLPGHACGELRLIYRLAYTAQVGGEAVTSRLPMTATVDVFDAGRGDAPSSPAAIAQRCADGARRWHAPTALAGVALGRWLVAAGGPLGPDRLSAARVARLQVNLQSVRWPSAVRPDLGGHAEYLMRAFAPDAGGDLEVAALDNMLDVDRVRRDPRLRAELVAWIRDGDNLARIDDGTALLPERFSAERAVSVAPRGLARLANRPFRQLLEPSELADLPLAGRRFAGSPEALVRRLDDLTCTGCHQSRAIAGFHLLGEDAADTAAGNALAVPRSPHLVDEVARREAVLAAVARGEPPDLARPFAERVAGGLASVAATDGYGARCGRGDPGFAAWSCAAGLTCDAYDAAPQEQDVVGFCVPSRPAVGDPCEVAPLRPHADPHRDRVRGARERACGAGAVCNINRVGFPGGMCTATCAALPPEAACGAIALLRPFNDCLARGEPFPRCLSKHATPAGLRACSETAPCRDDYVCARTASGGGACIPPYFLFQLRVDGHPR